ncbi:MAG: GtrA family protein [bacterium]|nr:GtrA family protein [bacterium]
MEQRFFKKDYLLALVSGFLTGIFLFPVLRNIEVAIPYQEFMLLIGLPVLMAFGLFLGGFLSRWIRVFYQASKFAVTGFLNAAVDFGVLNALIFFIGVNAGIYFSLFKGASFIIANINSYFWNKFWTFRKKAPAHLESLEIADAPKKDVSKEYIQFFVVSIIGLLINVGAATLVVNIIGPQFGIDANGWANIGAVAGSAAGLVWNFVGYKLIVFRV